MSIPMRVRVAITTIAALWSCGLAEVPSADTGARQPLHLAYASLDEIKQGAERIAYATAPAVIGSWSYRGLNTGKTRNSYTFTPASSNSTASGISSTTTPSCRSATSRARPDAARSRSNTCASIPTAPSARSSRPTPESALHRMTRKAGSGRGSATSRSRNTEQAARGVLAAPTPYSAAVGTDAGGGLTSKVTKF